MKENELREIVAESSGGVREFYEEKYRFRRFSSINAVAIFILGGAFAYFTQEAVAQWRDYYTADMNFLAWVILAGFCFLSAVGCYVSLGSEAARWALGLLQLFDHDFVEARLERFSRSWMASGPPTWP